MEGDWYLEVKADCGTRERIYQIRIDRNLSTPRVFEGVYGEGTIEKSMLKITLAV
jgi:hypothetical protein